MTHATLVAATASARAALLPALSTRAGFAYLDPMALRPILIHPDPRLRRTAEPVRDIDAPLRALVEDMFATMYDAPGIGLAATQLGVMKQRLRDGRRRQGRPARADGADQSRDPLDLRGGGRVNEEGCLSIPDVFEDVSRPARVRLAWTDLDGARQRGASSPTAGRSAPSTRSTTSSGRLFIDYLGAVKRTLITARMKKLKREKARA